MKIRTLIHIVFLAGILASCNRRDSRLADIDAIMEAEPATALARLDSIRPEALSPSDHAYYALLYTQAQVKCRIEVSSDSLISIAYSKYSHDSSGNLKMRAYFYNATVSFNQSDFKSAMKDAVVAYDIAKESDNHYWIAKTAELMADILWYVYNYSQSEVYTHEAVENYLLAGRIDNHRYALCDLASIYLNEDKLDEAKSLVDSLYDIVTHEMPIDSALLDYMSMARSAVLLRTNQLNVLEKVLQEPSKLTDITERKVDVSIINSILLDQNEDTEGAESFLSDAYSIAEDEKQRIRVMYADFKRALSAEKYQKAAILADSVILIQSGIVEELLKESVIGVQSDFYSEKALYQQRQAEWRLYALVTVSLVAVIITILVFMIFRLKLRARKAEFEANLSSLMHYKKQEERTRVENRRLSSELIEKSEAIESLNKRIEDKSQAEEQNSIVIEHLFREKWSTLNMLCDEYFEKDDSENNKTAILKNIEKELAKQKTRKSLKEIETAVDSYLGNIMSLLRQECGFLKEDDFVFLSLVYAGLSSKSVCLFTDIKRKLFYLKKDRLLKRIADSTAAHKELFIDKMK